MASSRLTRIEFSLLAEDAELLQRYAKSHGTPASEIVRAALYEYVRPLRRAKEEREERTYREMEERRKLAEWEGRKGMSSDYDPAAPERYAPWQEE